VVQGLVLVAHPLYIHTHTHTHIHTYIHTHTHTYVGEFQCLSGQFLEDKEFFLASILTPISQLFIRSLAAVQMNYLLLFINCNWAYARWQCLQGIYS
jgi:hypothetical protein